MTAGIRNKSVTDLLGVPPPPKTGRERLLAVAIDLFYRNGFGAIGVDRIVEEAGVTKTTFYKHFESKEDLIVDAVKQRDEWELRAWNSAIHRLAGDDPIKQIFAMLDVLDRWFNDPDYQGCMFTNSAIEFPNANDPIHQAAAAHKRKVRDQWRDVAVTAGADASGAETFADCFTALIEGALILRHAHGRDDAARAVRPGVERLVAAFIRETER